VTIGRSGDQASAVREVKELIGDPHGSRAGCDGVNAWMDRDADARAIGNSQSARTPLAHAD